MDFKLELVLIPVSDVDRAKEFYVETCGFNLDVDHQPNERVPRRPDHPARLRLLAHDRDRAHRRGARLLPRHAPRSSPTSRPARAELVGRGVEVSEIRHMSAEWLGAGRGP